VPTVQEHVYKALLAGGIKQLSNKLEGLKTKKGFRKTLYLLDKKLLGGRQFIYHCAQAEEKIAKLGISKVSSKLLEKLGLDCQVIKEVNPESKEDGAVLFVGLNHQAFIEPIILAASVKRNDLYLIAMKTYQLIGKGVKKHLLPVMPRRYTSGRIKKLWEKIENLFIFTTNFYSLENVSLKKAKDINNSSLEKAVRLLRQGHAVAIFPGGGRRLSQRWKRGLGEIIHRLQKTGVNQVRLIPVYFSKISKFKVIKTIRNNCLGGKDTAKIKVHFGKEIHLKELETFSNPAEIIDFLKERIFRENRLYQKIPIARLFDLATSLNR